MNKNQKAFLKTLQKSIDQAQSAQVHIFNALEMPGLDVGHKKICLKYAMDLQVYAEAAHKMMIDCTLAYGKGSNAIAIDAMANHAREN